MSPSRSLSLILLFAAVSASAQTPRTVVGPRTNAANPNDPPFSAAVRVGDTLYISGQIGLGPDRKPPIDVIAEARLVMDAVKKVLAAPPEHLVLVVRKTLIEDVSRYYNLTDFLVWPEGNWCAR